MNARATFSSVAWLLFVVSTLSAQPVLNKGIIPIVGSMPGANGSYFHTSIRLAGKEGLHGRLVFHWVGKVADDVNDPSLAYRCAALGCLQVGDVSAIIGDSVNSTGMGSLDIIPDSDSEQILPNAFVRLWNAAPLNAPAGILEFQPFGSIIPQLMPSDFLSRQQSASSDQRSFFIPGVPVSVRRSIGFRTLTPITYSVIVVSAAGLEETVVGGAALPADFTMLQPLSQILGRADDPKTDIKVVIESGSAIGFYSYTHSITNDPTVIVAPAVHASGS